MKRRFGDHTLTERQRAVLDLVERGMTHDQVAAKLGIARGSVGKHLKVARYHREASAFYAQAREEGRRDEMALLHPDTHPCQY